MSGLQRIIDHIGPELTLNIRFTCKLPEELWCTMLIDNLCSPVSAAAHFLYICMSCLSTGACQCVGGSTVGTICRRCGGWKAYID